MENGSSIFKVNSDTTLEKLKTLCSTDKNVFLTPTGAVSYENAALAMMLNEYVNWERTNNRKQYRSFYTNTRYESMHGAIKVARHYRYLKKKQISSVLVFDPDSKISSFIDPVIMNEKEKGFIEEIKYTGDFVSFSNSISSKNGPGIVLFPANTLDTQQLDNILNLCKKNNIISIMALFDHDFSVKSELFRTINILPDILVFDEKLTNYEVPFAVFLIDSKIHKPWTSLPLATIHSSTYVGNRLSVSLALENLQSRFSWYQEREKLKKMLQKMADNDSALFKAYKKYINPGLMKFYSVIGFDFICKNASGSRLNVVFRDGTKSELIDCVTGGGAALRGHAVKDVNSEVLEKHDKQKNYWEILKKKMAELTGLPCCFPSVSGATAVDNAILLATLANNDKKILIFRGNYAGKTLVSLLGTEDEHLRSPFISETDRVIYTDPFEENALEKIEHILMNNEIGVIWFEIIQGSSIREIPFNVAEYISVNKSRYKYLIGTDEILMGFYRVGELFNSNRMTLKPDIITISKALSDGLIPIGITCVSEDIYKKAVAKNKSLVDYVEKLYVNQLSSHIALHCIEKLRDPEFQSNRKKVQSIFEKGFGEIADEIPFVKNITGKGHIYKMYYENANILFSFYICRKFVKDADIFVFMERLSPSLSISTEDAELIIKRIKEKLKKEQKFLSIKFFFYMIEVVLKMIA